VDSINAAIDEIARLFCGPVNSNICNGFRVILAALNSSQQWRRKASPGSKFCHSLQAGNRCDGHETSDHRNGDAGECAARFPVKECVVVKEQLRNDEISAGVHLGLQVVHLQQRVWCFGVTFWKPCNTNSKATWIWVAARVIECLDGADKVDGVMKV
jgi:hypothetical protein